MMRIRLRSYIYIYVCLDFVRRRTSSMARLSLYLTVLLLMMSIDWG